MQEFSDNIYEKVLSDNAFMLADAIKIIIE